MNFSDYLVYDETSPSCLRWKVDRSGGAKAGDVAGCLQRKTETYHRYILGFAGKLRMAHRVVWELLKGPIQAGQEIDHLDGNPLNNRISNLRLVSRAENARNLRKFRNNTTGITGICRELTPAGIVKWRAFWHENGKIRSRSFSTRKYGEEAAKEMAVAAREEAIRRLGFYTDRHGM